MAKEDMLCPFSAQLCKECPLYRGRHYYMCFCSKYRGHMKAAGEIQPGAKEEGEPVWMPPKMPSAVDPFQRTMPDITDNDWADSAEKSQR